MPFLFCTAGLLRATGRGISTAFVRELLPAGWLPGRWGVFSVPAVCDRAGHIHNLCVRTAPRRLAARQMGIFSVPAACDRAGHIHNLWGRTAPRRLAARQMGVFSVPAACDRAGHIHNLWARIAPRRGEKFFRPCKIDRCPWNEPGPERPAGAGRMMGQGCPVPGRFRRRLTAVFGKDCPRFFASEAAKSMEKFPKNPALISQNQPEASR